MGNEQRLQQILTLAGGFLMPLGLAVIGIGWYGTAHTGYVFEQVPYQVSGGLLGLGLTNSWLARLVSLQREQAELIRRLADRPTAPEPDSTRLLPTVEPDRAGVS
jgi:hypothetical protein